ncbi:hypothetical protein SVIOM342S_01363 [Streptomyces violaceorubidus]
MAEDRLLRARGLLDAVRAEGRTVLTAPEGKVLADAYGIAVPGEELGTWTVTRWWHVRCGSAGRS